MIDLAIMKERALIARELMGWEVHEPTHKFPSVKYFKPYIIRPAKKFQNCTINLEGWTPHIRLGLWPDINEKIFNLGVKYRRSFEILVVIAMKEYPGSSEWHLLSAPASVRFGAVYEMITGKKLKKWKRKNP